MKEYSVKPEIIHTPDNFRSFLFFLINTVAFNTGNSPRLGSGGNSVSSACQKDSVINPRITIKNLLAEQTSAGENIPRQTLQKT